MTFHATSSALVILTAMGVSVTSHACCAVAIVSFTVVLVPNFVGFDQWDRIAPRGIGVT